MRRHAKERVLADPGDISVDRFIMKMRRRETLRLGLMTFFLLNATVAALFSVWVWWTRNPGPGFLVPALIIEAGSLGLLLMLWRRSNRLRSMGEASCRPTSGFLAGILAETRSAIREHRLLLLAVTLILTPLFAVAVWHLIGAGKMAPSDAASIAVLYVVGLVTVVGVTWTRLRRHLVPGERYLRRLVSEYKA